MPNQVFHYSVENLVEIQRRTPSKNVNRNGFVTFCTELQQTGL